MGKVFVFISLLVLLGSCGKQQESTLVKKGKNGSSCSVTQTDYGAEVSCTDGTKATLYNGADGDSFVIEDLSNGALITCGDTHQIIYDGGNFEVTNDTIVEIIDPCGDNPGEFDELLFRTHGGSLVAYFEEDNKRFLTSLSPGKYQTTDKQECNFTVEIDLSITY